MMEKVRHLFLGGLNAPDEDVEHRMIEAIDAALGHPPRMDLPVGTMIFRQDDPLDGIYILIDGKVSLFQLIDGKEVVFHSQTVGRILGLLALTRQSRSFFHCRAVTPVTLLKVSFADLDRALQQSDTLLVSFITVLLRSMARRNKRLVELQTEVLGLNKSLANERDTLAKTLRELRKAQALLVESEKMATLGQLSAGVAHELNNPVAAIQRAADFVHQDLLQMVDDLPDAPAYRAMLDRSFNQAPLSTREQRERRRQLAAELGDESLAERLVAIGITEASAYRDLAATWRGSAADHIARLERMHQLGGALRNIVRCADRIGGLVKSLRAYARADHDESLAINLHEGLEDTLRLFTNRMREVTVERDFGDLPPVRGLAGELNQVWTNLIANALDAMKNQGRLVIATRALPDGQVSVSVIDDGPGIAPENIDKIFNLRFTTRQGRVEFGLGLGLSISRNIVTRHGGSISVESRPGRTAFCVKLPVSRPETALSNQQEPEP